MHPRSLRFIVMSVVLSFGLRPNCFAQGSPQTPIPTITSPQPPTDVFIPDAFGGLSIDYFDDYSWRALVALVWPAVAGHRDVPATSKTIGASGTRVFETYKSLWEIFYPHGTAPSSTSFNDDEQSKFNACNSPVSFGDLVLATFSKFSDLGQAGAGSFSWPDCRSTRTLRPLSNPYNSDRVRLHRE
jgi:hypothetical protein